MAEFPPKLQPSNDPSYLSSSQGTDRAQVNQAYGELFSNLGSVWTGALSVADTEIKRQVRKDVEGRTDALYNEFGVGDAAAIAATGQAPTNILGEPTLAGEANIKGSGAPQGVKRLGNTMRDLTELYNSGKLSPSYYHGRLTAMTRELYNQYPGYREEVDKEIISITGIRPQEALRKSLLADQDAATRGAQAGQKAEEAWRWKIQEHVTPDSFLAYLSGRKTKLDLEIEAAGNRSEDQKNTRLNRELELKSKQGRITKDEVSGVLYQNIYSDVRRQISGAISSTFGQTFQDIRTMAENPQFQTPTAQAQINQDLTRMEAGLLARARAIANRPGSDGISLAQRMLQNGASQADVENIIKLALSDFYDLKSAFTDKATGYFTHKATEMTLRQDAQMNEALNRNPRLNAIMIARKIAGDQTIAQALRIPGSGLAVSDYANILSNIEAAATSLPPGTVGNNRPGTASGAPPGTPTRKTSPTEVIRQNEYLWPTGKKDKDLADFTKEYIRKSMGIATTQGVPPEMSKEVLKTWFGESNSRFFELLDTGMRRQAYTLFASPEVIKKVHSLGDGEVIRNYQDFMKNRAFASVFKDAADTLASAADFERFVYRWNPNTTQWEGEVKPEFAHMYQGPGRMNRVLQPLSRINDGLKTLRTIVEANGEEPNQALVKIMQDSFGLTVSQVEKRGKEPVTLPRDGLRTLWNSLLHGLSSGAESGALPFAPEAADMTLGNWLKQFQPVSSAQAAPSKPAPAPVSAPEPTGELVPVTFRDTKSGQDVILNIPRSEVDRYLESVRGPADTSKKDQSRVNPRRPAGR